MSFSEPPRGPHSGNDRGSHSEDFRSSITWLSDWLSTLRRVRYLTRRKTRFWPLVKRYQTGFSPAGSIIKGLKCNALFHFIFPLRQASWRNPRFFIPVSLFQLADALLGRIAVSIKLRLQILTSVVASVVNEFEQSCRFLDIFRTCFL